MQKLKLDLDTLEVVSFNTSAGEPEGRGTVLGQAASVTVAPLTVLTPQVYSYFACD